MAAMLYDKQWPRQAVSYGRGRGPYVKKKLNNMNARYTRPIMSYGILLYTFRKGEPVFLLCQRRHTIEFVELILSKIPKERLLSACARLTEEERQKLCEWSFDALWDDFLPQKNCRLYFDDKEEMKTRFERNKKEMVNCILSTTSSIFEPQWGFPKGKKNTKESSIVCAVREFVEETGMERNRIQIVDDSNPFIERFIGTNGKIYGSQYFLAYSDEEIKIQKKDFGGVSTISEEISELKWATYEEAKRVLSPERVEILQNAILCIRTAGTT
ncbi:NUDIX hydrolase [Tunisvirus fontaine2]|uniref:NUDIX hydrolase n=1 Tax=Tunisvirus fontaine2 TaxID=1421067 RepID=V9SF27_9VIRU|nr:NUDIX hydrolase [Tunisvirus fontaine2]AHC54921.1 NUDIX hydrolase [Tunisvirus fontaine2]